MNCRFTVTMLCVPGKPMLELVSEDELQSRASACARRTKHPG